MIEIEYIMPSKLSSTKWVEGTNKFFDTSRAIRFGFMVKRRNGIITLITGDDNEEVQRVSNALNISDI